MVLSLNLLILLSEAFATSAQSSQASVNDRWYLIVVATALSGALVYMFKRYEQMNGKFNEERERTFTQMQHLLQESNEAKNKLSGAIETLNRDSEERHRSTMRMLDQIHAKT